MYQTSDKGIVYQEKPFQGLRNISAICSVLGCLSFLGGLVVAVALAAESYDPVAPFILGLSAGFITGIGYLIMSDLIKLLIGVKENLDEMVNNTRLITAQLERTNLKE